MHSVLYLLLLFRKNNIDKKKKLQKYSQFSNCIIIIILLDSKYNLLTDKILHVIGNLLNFHCIELNFLKNGASNDKILFHDFDLIFHAKSPLLKYY